MVTDKITIGRKTFELKGGKAKTHNCVYYAIFFNGNEVGFVFCDHNELWSSDLCPKNVNTRYEAMERFVKEFTKFTPVEDNFVIEPLKKFTVVQTGGHVFSVFYNGECAGDAKKVGNQWHTDCGMVDNKNLAIAKIKDAYVYKVAKQLASK